MSLSMTLSDLVRRDPTDWRPNFGSDISTYASDQK